MNLKVIIALFLSISLSNAQESLINFENISLLNKHSIIDSSSINIPLNKNGKSNLLFNQQIIQDDFIYFLFSNIEDFGSGFLVEKYQLSSNKKIWQTTYDLRNTEFHHSPNYFFLNKQQEIEVISFRRSSPLNPFVGWVESTLSIHKIDANNGNIISNTFGDATQQNITVLNNGFGFTKIRPTDQNYQYYYLGNLENPIESGCTFQEMNAQGTRINKGAVNFNMELEKFQFSSLYNEEITVFEYYLNTNDSNFKTYISTYSQAWDKISKQLVDLKIEKPRSARISQKVLDQFVIETYVESDQKRAYHLIYLDTLLNIVDEIKLPLTYQYHYASTVLNANLGHLLVHSIPVLDQGKARCKIKFYLSKGGEDKLIKESLVSGNKYLAPHELKDLKDGKILFIGTYGEIADNSGNPKLGSTEEVALILDLETLGVTASKDEHEVHDFKIVPNPVTQNLRIECNVQYDEVFIFNINGALMNQKTTNNFVIDFFNYPRGFYFCELRNNGKFLGRQKFVKTE